MFVTEYSSLFQQVDLISVPPKKAIQGGVRQWQWVDSETTEQIAPLCSTTDPPLHKRRQEWGERTREKGGSSNAVSPPPRLRRWS